MNDLPWDLSSPKVLLYAFFAATSSIRSNTAPSSTRPRREQQPEPRRSFCSATGLSEAFERMPREPALVAAGRSTSRRVELPQLATSQAGHRQIALVFHAAISQLGQNRMQCPGPPLS